MAQEEKNSLQAIARVLSSIAGIASPFILYFVVSIYGRLDSYGNRITAIEERVQENRRIIDNNSLGLNENTKNDLVRWDKIHDEISDVRQDISFLKIVK